MTNRINFNQNIALDSNGDPMSGAKAYFYDTGTTDAQTVYSDTGLSVAVSQPLVAASDGSFATTYSADTTDLKVVIKSAADVTLHTIDPAVVQSTGGGASTITFAATSSISSTDVQAAIVEVDAKVLQLIKDVNIVYATAGSSNAYTVAVSGVTAYTAGNVYWVRADRDNSGAATLNVQSVGAKNWKYYDDSGALVDYATGELTNGSEFKVLYDGTRFVTIARRHDILSTADLEAGTSTNPGAIAPASVKAAVEKHAAVLQVASTNYVTHASGTTTIPADDTIPQITEGDEYFTIAFTPLSASSTLYIDVNFWLAPGSNSTAAVALFVDTTAGALAATSEYRLGDQETTLHIALAVASGSTSARTYRVRAGGTTGTLYANGLSGGRRYGGVGNSTIRVTEIQ